MTDYRLKRCLQSFLSVNLYTRMMRILTITTAADLFLDDISAEDYRELVMDHNVDCQCSQCQIFNKLVMLEENFSRYLQGQPVSDEVLELCQKKYQRYSREHTKQ